MEDRYSQLQRSKIQKFSNRSLRNARRTFITKTYDHSSRIPVASDGVINKKQAATTCNDYRSRIPRRVGSYDRNAYDSLDTGPNRGGLFSEAPKCEFATDHHESVVTAQNKQDDRGELSSKIHRYIDSMEREDKIIPDRFEDSCEFLNRKTEEASENKEEMSEEMSDSPSKTWNPLSPSILQATQTSLLSSPPQSAKFAYGKNALTEPNELGVRENVLTKAKDRYQAPYKYNGNRTKNHDYKSAKAILKSIGRPEFSWDFGMSESKDQLSDSVENCEKLGEDKIVEFGFVYIDVDDIGNGKCNQIGGVLDKLYKFDSKTESAESLVVKKSLKVDNQETYKSGEETTADIEHNVEKEATRNAESSQEQHGLCDIRLHEEVNPLRWLLNTKWFNNANHKSQTENDETSQANGISPKDGNFREDNLTNNNTADPLVKKSGRLFWRTSELREAVVRAFTRWPRMETKSPSKPTEKPRVSFHFNEGVAVCTPLEEENKKIHQCALQLGQMRNRLQKMMCVMITLALVCVFVMGVGGFAVVMYEEYYSKPPIVADAWTDYMNFDYLFINVYCEFLAFLLLEC